MFDLDYFVEKFGNAPEWGISIENTDVWELCSPEEAESLYKIVKPYGILLDVNDDINNEEYVGNSPKERVINFLIHIKQRRGSYIL